MNSLVASKKINQQQRKEITESWECLIFDISYVRVSLKIALYIAGTKKAVINYDTTLDLVY